MSLKAVALAGLLANCLSLAPAFAQTVYWGDWTAPAGFPTGGTPGSGGGFTWDYWNGVTGTIALPGGGSISTAVTGEVMSTSCFAANAAACSGNAFFWASNSWSTYGAGTFTSQYVANGPNTGQIVSQSGYSGSGHTLTFSQPATNVVMSVWSLGGTAGESAYVFTQDFIILSQDPRCDLTSGYYCLVKDGRTLRGVEGAGTILFIGTYSSISWTVTVSEYYSGFTVGITNAPSSVMTVMSLQSQLPQLVSVLNHELAVLNNGLNYDCDRFGQNNWCVSGGARYTATSGADINNAAGNIIIAYKPYANVRIGAFLDYSTHSGAPSGFEYGDATPMVGAFAGYGEQEGSGVQARASIAYKRSELHQTRDASLPYTERGNGGAALHAWAAQIEVGYGIRVNQSVLVSPFVAFRAGNVSRNGYTEHASSDVTAPLTFARFGISQSDVVAGVRGVYALTSRFSVGASLSVERTLWHDEDSYSGSSAFPGIQAFSIATPAPTKSARLAGGLAAGYKLDEGKWLSIGVSARDLPYNNERDISVRLTLKMAL